MDFILEHLSFVMILGLTVVVVLSQFSRRVGAVLGLVFWTAMIAVGHIAYARGGAIGLLTIRFPESVFYGICALFIAMNALAFRTATRARRGQKPNPD